MRRRTGQNGSALVEFVLCFALLWIPLLVILGTAGLSLIRIIQTTLVCRNAAHLYASGTDFSQAGSQTLLVSLAPGLGMTNTGGNAVIILSTIKYVSASDCQAGGYGNGGCANLNHYAFTRRLYIGSHDLHASTFGNPDSMASQADGSIATADILRNAGDRADSFGLLITLPAGQSAFVAEMWAASPPGVTWLNGVFPQTAARFVF